MLFRVLTIIAIMSCAGCVVPEKADMAAVAQNWKTIGPDYLRYVQADPALKPDDKLLRVEQVTELDKVIAGYNARKQ